MLRGVKMVFAEVFMVSNEKEQTHAFSSRARVGIEITGVKEVISFDEGGVALETVCGNMAIEGEGLHVTTLSLSEGKVVVDGKINGVYYYESKPTVKKGLFGRRID